MVRFNMIVKDGLFVEELILMTSVTAPSNWFVNFFCPPSRVLILHVGSPLLEVGK